jgi:UDP-glucuronate 4-epimerase
MTQRVLITGAAGFIGGHCSRALLDAGYAVVGLDNFDPFYDRAIKEQALSELTPRPDFSFVEADIRDRDAVTKALAGVDAVLHLAARAGVRPSIEEPSLYSSINVEGSITLLESCKQLGISRFVFGSSSSVYGDTTPAPFREDAPALDPISPYAATKRAGELACRVYTHLYEMRIAALRFFTVYGARQRPDLAIHRFTRLLHEGKPIQQYGDGSSERDYTHVDDIVKGVAGAMRWVDVDEPGFEIFNLGESQTVRLDQLITLISGASGIEPKIERLPSQPGDVRRTYADISKAREMLGYSPSIAIDDGIPAFVSWYEDTYGR